MPKTEETKKEYEVIGLQPADTMPIEFDGQTYDLVSLSPSQLEYLLQFPDQVPYLKKL